MSENALTCANHPDIETRLRCKKCEKPICPKCAVHTPTGYQCRECIRSRQKIFDTSLPQDYVIGFITAAVLSAIGSFLISLAGFHHRFLWDSSWPSSPRRALGLALPKPCARSQAAAAHRLFTSHLCRNHPRRAANGAAANPGPEHLRHHFPGHLSLHLRPHRLLPHLRPSHRKINPYAL
jgi:hypothetical protein